MLVMSLEGMLLSENDFFFFFLYKYHASGSAQMLSFPKYLSMEGSRGSSIKEVGIY